MKLLNIFEAFFNIAFRFVLCMFFSHVCCEKSVCTKEKMNESTYKMENATPFLRHTAHFSVDRTHAIV